MPRFEYVGELSQAMRGRVPRSCIPQFPHDEVISWAETDIGRERYFWVPFQNR